jgi:hypothetical protein
MKLIHPLIHGLVYCLACLLFAPPQLHAAELISLDINESKLVARGEIVVREVTSIGQKGRAFEAIGFINASGNSIVKVLKDYKKYPEFMPNVSNIEIIEQGKNESQLNYTLALPMGKIKKYRLRMSERAPEKNVFILEWRMLKWLELPAEDTIADTTGYWLIDEKRENLSLVMYHVFTDPGPVPFGLGWIVDVLSKKSVPDVLLQTRFRVEKLSM